MWRRSLPCMVCNPQFPLSPAGASSSPPSLAIDWQTDRIKSLRNYPNMSSIHPGARRYGAPCLVAQIRSDHGRSEQGPSRIDGEFRSGGVAIRTKNTLQRRKHCFGTAMANRIIERLTVEPIQQALAAGAGALAGSTLGKALDADRLLFLFAR